VIGKDGDDDDEICSVVGVGGVGIPRSRHGELIGMCTVQGMWSVRGVHNEAHGQKEPPGVLKHQRILHH
jgi:hypothetical protein